MLTRLGDNTITVDYVGEIDIATAGPLRDALLAELADDTVTTVVFDLADVTFMDSSGAEMIIAAADVLRARGGTAIVCNVPEVGLKVFEVLGVDRTVTVYPRAD